ncbi:TetR/AcrR family transcriptional regulator [Kordiimonas lipolytica]|uniref:TetR/AcrR family transcriptional regulator n=1 Tax=Kordiimonas lipolytica TaxID=1662421 RepID=A0ABV8UG58_9PROT|nr:TetR family transcriptional regulator [Kordiimonas lipolytica]
MGESASTRVKVLEAALKVIARSGVDAVTHRCVAREAGVSNGVASYHFKTREALIQEAFKYHLGEVEELHPDFSHRIEGVNTRQDLIDLLLEIVQRDMDDPICIPAEYELILYARKDRELARLFSDWEFKAQAQLAQALERLGYAKPNLTARVVISLIRGLELEVLIQPALSIDVFRQRLELVLLGN